MSAAKKAYKNPLGGKFDVKRFMFDDIFLDNVIFPEKNKNEKRQV